MTVVLGWEPILRGLEQKLRDNLPGALAQVQARYPDAVILQEPAIYYRHVPQDNSVFPAIYIVPGDRLSPEAQNGGWMTTVADVRVAIEFEQPDAASCSTAMQRYEAAIRSVVLQAPYPDPCMYVGWVDTIPGDIAQFGTGAAFRSWVEIQLEAKVFEEALS